MKITKIQIQGQKKPVEIENGKNILIIGKNGIGKSDYLRKFIITQNKNNYYSFINFPSKLLIDHINTNLSDDADLSQFIKELKKAKFINLDLFNPPKLLIDKDVWNNFHPTFNQKYLSQIDAVNKNFVNVYLSYGNKMEDLINNLKQIIINSNINNFDEINKQLNYFMNSNKKFKIQIKKSNRITLGAELKWFINGKEHSIDFFRKTYWNDPPYLLSDGEWINLIIFILFNKKFTKYKDSNIYTWDEPELHLHPSHQKKLLDFLSNETSAQFIMVTQSPIILRQILLMKDKWIVFNMKRNEKGIIELQKFNEIKGQDRKNILDDYGIPNSFIIVEGELDKKYLEVCFKEESYYEIISIGGIDSIKKAPKGFTKLIKAIYSTWKIKPVFIKDQDDKKGKTTEEILEKVFTKEERKNYCYLLSNHGHDQNLKDIEQVLINELNQNADKKEDLEQRLRLTEESLNKLPKKISISKELLDNIKVLNKEDPLIFFKGSSIEKNILDNIDKNVRSECKKYLKTLINNRKKQLCNVLTKHHQKIVKAGLKNLVNAIKKHYGIDPANSHIYE